jgi:hypothetical protein
MLPQRFTPTFTAQPGASANLHADVTYTTQTGESSYTWTYSGTVNVDYTITSGGGNTNSVILKWITPGYKIVHINYTNSNGCAAESATASTTTTVTLQVGDAYQGGIIFYVTGSVPTQTGLIAATSDQSTGAQWGCSGTSVATSTAIGTSASNTHNIVTACTTPGIAAKICDDLSLNGYSDWHLPSKGELDLMYTYRVIIGGFDITKVYWSSSQYSTTKGEDVDFEDGLSHNEDKTQMNHVRAIRSF